MTSLGTIYTLEEAADRLRMTPRRICKIARAHGLCSRAGRTYLFSEEDIEGIWNAAREATNRTFPPKVMPPLVADRAFESLLRHVMEKKALKKGSR